MRNLLLAIVLLGNTTFAQTTHVVDASGKLGKFRTVVAAMNAAKSGDKILIHPGTYVGTLDPQGKGLALIGATGKAYDVMIRSSSPQGTALLVSTLKAGLALRLSSLTLDHGSNPGKVVVLGNGAGDVFFENIWSGMSWSVRTWSGTVSLANCLARVPSSVSFSPKYALEFDGVKQVFIRDSVIESVFLTGLFFPAVGVIVKSSDAEIVQTSITGPDGYSSGSRYSSDGGAGLVLVNSRVRISGDGTDIVAGGRSQVFSSSSGGAGVLLRNSTLDWSGTTIRGGAATGMGNP